MPNWNCLIDESALASLLPGEQSRFARPVSEALAVFLAGLPAHHDQFRLAELIVEALVVRPIFSLEGYSLFHSDPHAGNLFYTSDHRLAILDWSLAGSLNETQRIAIVQIMLAALTLDNQSVVAILEGLAERQEVDRAALMGVVNSWLRRLRQGYFPGIRWLVGILDEAVLTARLRVSSGNL